MSDSGNVILIVDDDVDLLATVSDFLRFEGFTVESASSGEAGLEKLNSVTPDMIILDISMPGIGGVGFLKEMARIERVSRVPVLVFTARANMEQFFKEVEVAGFLAKPCDPAELLSEVGRILGRAGAASPQGGAGRRKVLIAEDDAGRRETISAALVEAGFEVVAVANAPEVIERAIVEKPDVLLVKLVMEKMNGDTIVSMMGDIPSTAAIPVILYDHTGSSPRSRILSTKGKAARTFVRSPTPSELAQAAVSALQTG